MAKERSLNIFDVMKAMDRGDYSYYGSVNREAEKKELDSTLGLPLLRWMSGAESGDEAEFALMSVNEIANQRYFEFEKYKELQAKLLTAGGARTWMKHVWVPPMKSRKLGHVHEVLSRLYPDINGQEVELWIELNGREGIEEVAKVLGLQKDDRKKLIDEYEKMEKSK